MKSKNKTLKELFNEYISFVEYTQGYRPQTIIGYKETFKHFITIMPDIKLPSDVTYENMNLFFKELRTRERPVGKNEIRVGVKQSTVKTYWSKLKVFFNWLVIKEVIKENPLTKIKIPDPIYDDKKDLDPSDIDKIIGGIDRKSKNSYLSQKR